jgi:ribosomal protein S15P/S13E
MNNPVRFVDPDGRFVLPAKLIKKYPRLAHYLKHVIRDIANNKTVVNALKKYGEFTDKQINEALKWKKGPKINVTQLGTTKKGNIIRGQYSTKEPDVLNIDVDIVNQLENATGEDRDAALLNVASTILHEFTHLGEYKKDGKFDNKVERGEAFEKQAYSRDIDNLNDAKEVLNEYNQRHGIEKRYSTTSNTIQLEEVIITVPKK